MMFMVIAVRVFGHQISIKFRQIYGSSYPEITHMRELLSYVKYLRLLYIGVNYRGPSCNFITPRPLYNLSIHMPL